LAAPSPCTRAVSGWADPSQPSMAHISLAVGPARGWLGARHVEVGLNRKPEV
jgi:hypothetical protein